MVQPQTELSQPQQPRAAEPVIRPLATADITNTRPSPGELSVPNSTRQEKSNSITDQTNAVVELIHSNLQDPEGGLQKLATTDITDPQQLIAENIQPVSTNAEGQQQGTGNQTLEQTTQQIETKLAVENTDLRALYDSFLSSSRSFFEQNNLLQQLDQTIQNLVDAKIQALAIPPQMVDVYTPYVLRIAQYEAVPALLADNQDLKTRYDAQVEQKFAVAPVSAEQFLQTKDMRHQMELVMKSPDSQTLSNFASQLEQNAQGLDPEKKANMALLLLKIIVAVASIFLPGFIGQPLQAGVSLLENVKDAREAVMGVGDLIKRGQAASIQQAAAPAK